MKDAFLHVPIHPSHYKFLLFAIGDEVYKFVVLPFGLTSAPRVFTKMVAPVAEWLHARETSMFPYIDDLQLWEISRVKAQVATDRGLLTLSSLGWVINVEKSNLVPTQCLDFIGATFRTDLGRAFMPQDRRDVLVALT